MRENRLGYRLFFETAADGMLTVGGEGKVLDANLRACDLLRRGREEVVGSDLEDLYDPSLPTLEAALEESDRTGSSKVSARLLRGDGSSFPAEVRVTGGGEGGFGVAFREIDRREEDGAPRASAAEYRAMVEGSMDAMAVFDANNTFRYANPAFERLMGYETNEFVGMFVPDVVHPEDLARAGAFIAEIQNNPGPVRIPGEFRYRHKDGHWVYLETSLNNLMDDPQVRGMVAVCRDVTDRVQAEEALRESEERFRALVENAQDFIALADENNVARYASPSIEQIVGYTPEEFVGTAIHEYIHPDDLQRTLKMVSETLPVPGPHNLGAIKYRRKDGSDVYLEVVVNNRLEDPALRGVVCNCRDVTGRVLAEEALRASEERFRLLMQNQPDFIVLADEENVFRYVSPSVERVMGYKPEEMIGTVGAGYLHPEDLEWAARLNEQIAAGAGPTEPVVARYRHKDGSYRYIEYPANNLIHDPNVRGVVINCRDVTERVEAQERLKESEERLARSNEELARSNAELEQFAFFASHGLRSPLRGIAERSEVLLEDYGDALDPEARDQLLSLRSSGRYLEQLVSDLLNLSRVAHAPLREEIVDLSALASKIAGDLREAEPGREVQFEIEEGLVATGDPNLLGVVLENLIANAWKYTSKEEQARIRFGATEHGGNPAYFVRDDGVGFDERRAGELFEPFRRLHRASEFEGTGIGLATVERIVGRHGGRVWAEGEAGEGASFYFTLGPKP